MDRRDFLKYSGLLFFSSLIPFGLSGWVAGITDGIQVGEDKRKRLIILFQRGAVDGLSLVVPYGESYYYDARPTISIAAPGKGASALELNGDFGLHPSLSGVMPLWKTKKLAFIDACGSPDPTRSHFDAQEYMENGTPGVKTTGDGWLNRLLVALSESKSNLRAVAVGPTIPLILKGRIPVENIPSAIDPTKPMITDRPNIVQQFDHLYQSDKELESAYREGLAARKQLLSDLEEERMVADHGAPQPKGFEANCSRLATLMSKDPTMQIAFLDVGGWDTHINQGGSSGQLANHLKQFGNGVSSLASGLGAAFENTLVVVMSEFGRTVKENGNGGTDHGHGNLMWVLGGPINGGKVYGEWPGLEQSSLYENRDLSVTTDFRVVLGYLVGKHFGINSKGIDNIFPNVPSLAKNSLASLQGLYTL